MRTDGEEEKLEASFGWKVQPISHKLVRPCHDDLSSPSADDASTFPRYLLTRILPSAQAITYNKQYAEPLR